MKKIIQDIKNNEIEKFYLLYGPEDYLKHQYRDKLVKALVSTEDNMNYTVFSDRGFDLKSFLDLGETLPFFSENRVIVVENSRLFKKSSEGIEKRMQNFPESTHVIFVESEIDKRLTLWKWFSKNGYASEMKSPTESELRKWIGKMCRDEKKQIYENAVEYFLELIGMKSENMKMFLIVNEMEKIFSYIGDREEITIDDIKEVCVDEAEDTMFAMLDAVFDRDRQQALVLYRKLLGLKMNSLAILANMSNQIRRLLEISVLVSEGKSNDDIASISRVPKWSIGKYKKQIRRNDGRSLKKMLERCIETDEWIKTGRVMDVVGIEMLIIEFSS